MDPFLKVLNATERANYDRWVAAHNLVCDCCNITLSVTGTSIGPVIKVSCSILKQHDLTDYDSW